MLALENNKDLKLVTLTSILRTYKTKIKLN